MQVQLLHLTGPHRGRTINYKGDLLLVGSEADASIRFLHDAVQPRHAEFRYVEEECAFYLKALDGPVFVNQREVYELILKPEDMLEIGKNGPKVRFRVFAEVGAFCKPVRQMLGDARQVGRVSGVAAFTSSVTNDLFTHASWKLKVGFTLLLLALMIPIASLAGWFAGNLPNDRIEQMVRERTQAYENKIENMVKQRERLDAKIDLLRKENEARAALVDQMIVSDAALRRIHDIYSLSVCLLHGVYGYERDNQGKIEQLIIDGRPATIEYTGSGFLASADGRIVTNRHIAEPWPFEDMHADMVKIGYRAHFVHFTATFPGHDPISVEFDTIKVRKDVDVAVVRVSPKFTANITVTPLFAGNPTDLRGKRAIVVGYPTGVHALLAKADSKLSTRLTSTPGANLTSIIQGLANGHAITPVITQGALNQVLPTRLVYDADTTSGGSGGPVFGPEGTVIGVNFAIMQKFTGSNFGVPVDFIRSLLAN